MGLVWSHTNPGGGVLIQIPSVLIQIHGRWWAVVLDDVRMVVDIGRMEMWFYDEFGSRRRIGGDFMVDLGGRRRRGCVDVEVLLLGVPCYTLAHDRQWASVTNISRSIYIKPGVNYIA
ncbi:Uncharacterized protein Fot_05143 [Forsythia ovata]|uniref:Uncharacterized protein n=1 Tax=Forsythia ovata TaxID=205694 RepID=A0ABD1WPC7_9LAMI